MAPPKILISDPVDPVCADLLKKSGFEVDQIKCTKEELLEKIKNYDGLIVRSETKATADVIEAGKKLKIIGRAGTGVDNVDCEAATKKGVLVMNTPGGNTLSAAEHTCALISSMARHIPQACASLKNGAWDRKLYSGHELAGKTLAILGLGRIGKEVAIRMQSYGMKTIGYDPIIPAEVTRAFGVESYTLEEIWPQADYITVHTPLIPQTRHLINDEVFKKCKKGVKLINVARGGIIEEESILRNLKNGLCGGAGLDVFCEEPPKSEYYKELLSHPLVVCTPHLGASTGEAQLRVAEEIAEQFVQFFNGTGLVGAVNAFSLANAMNGPNKVWLCLGRNLGLVASLFGEAKSIQINVNAPDIGDISFLSTAVASGYLSGVTSDESINMINGPALAKEKGIDINLKQSHEKNSIPSLTLNIKGSNSVVITGAFRGVLAVLTKIDDAVFPGGLVTEGPMLFFNGDKNGFSAIEGAVKDVLSIYRSTGGKTNWYVAQTNQLEEIKVDNVKFAGGRKF